MDEYSKLNKDTSLSPDSYWPNSVELITFPKCTQSLDVDVVVVGGGITGITTTYLLNQHGIKVALLESDKLLRGTTGHTTAKITVQHDLIYKELIDTLGEEKTKLYYEANNEALNFIQNTVHDLHIECEFKKENAYIYTQSDEYVSKLMNELNAYQKLGIEGRFLESIPLPIQIKGALVVENQAQFHPLKYLYSLIQSASKESLIYENTQVVDIEKGPRTKVITEDGHTISCDHVVVCTHFPFYDIRGLFFTRMYPERSYVLAIKPEKEYPGGMYLSAEDPKRSVRYTPFNGENLILVGGESHKTGYGDCTTKHYEALKTFGNQLFGIKEIPFRWSTQDLTTLDKVPYVGHITSNNPNIYVATGYRKWGMTNSTAASLLILDLILNRQNRFSELYTPSRFDSNPDIKSFISINTDVAKSLITNKLAAVHKKLEDLAPNEGAIVCINGKKAGAYLDSEHQYHIVDNTCTHLGCETQWNDAEKTWDCPCHGSRFSIDGTVVEGPTQKPLTKLN